MISNIISYLLKILNPLINNNSLYLRMVSESILICSEINLNSLKKKVLLFNSKSSSNNNKTNRINILFLQRLLMIFMDLPKKQYCIQYLKNNRIILVVWWRLTKVDTRLRILITLGGYLSPEILKVIVVMVLVVLLRELSGSKGWHVAGLKR